MKNKVVIRRKTISWGTVITYKDSNVGSDRKCNRFPLLRNTSLLPSFSVTHLEKGDILRCDGYPFCSRPKRIEVKTYNKHGKPQVSVFSPVKVGEYNDITFWALRNKRLHNEL